MWLAKTAQFSAGGEYSGAVKHALCTIEWHCRWLLWSKLRSRRGVYQEQFATERVLAHLTK